MKKQYHFLSGLPRSGSTVLSAILNQHPDVFVTPTSPMLDLLIENQNAWHNCPSVRANPYPEQLTNLTRAMIEAMWDHQPKPIIVDKNRGWGKNLPAAEILFNKKIKMIATTRDLPSIMASWLTLIKNDQNAKIYTLFKHRNIPPTDENLMAEMWFNMVKDCMESLQQAIKDSPSDMLLLVNYDDLVQSPTTVMNQIEDFLNIPHHTYDLNNIISDTLDNDMSAWGLDGMHTIHPTLTKKCKPSQEILGESLYNRFVELESRYMLSKPH